MAIKLNFNICDNAPECSGVAVCPTGAIYWNENALNPFSEIGTLCIDNTKCVACGNCVGEDGCPVGAIMFSDSEEELEKLTQNYETDLTKVERLFVERYGAAPIDESLCIDSNELNNIIENEHGIILIEKFADWSIQCLLSSIPIDTIIDEIKTITGIDSISFYRLDMTKKVDEGIELPVLDIYRERKLLCQIFGYIDNTQMSKIRDILEEKFK